MARERLYRMTEIQRNMLVVALMDEYRKQKARGVPYPPIGRLAVRAEDAPRHKNRLPWDKERLYDLYLNDAEWRMARDALNALRSWRCALPGFVDSKNEEKTERNAGYLVVSQSGGGMLRQGTRKGIRRTPANRGMRAHRIVKSLDISEDVCHGLCP